jgi:thymidylate synthase (FAD)
MNKIEVKILNPSAIEDAESMMVAMARLTQRGHNIANMQDFESMLKRPYSDSLVDSLLELPHPTIQKFGLINVVIVGASRRFLAQITRHQNEVKFMSGSLQYSDYSGTAQFCVPYEIIEADHNAKAEAACFSPNNIGELELLEDKYLQSCEDSLHTYEELAKIVGHDAAAYAMPQGLRNVLLMSATPFQWKHMIRQRTCNRNTLETQFIMLLVWNKLQLYSKMFSDCGPSCIARSHKGCTEGKMCCGRSLQVLAPYAECPGMVSAKDILRDKFGLVWRNGKSVNRT